MALPAAWMLRRSQYLERSIDEETGGLPITDISVVVLGNLLVGLLGSLVASARDLVGDVVAGVLDGIHFGWLG
jgi:hypothetical protein